MNILIVILALVILFAMSFAYFCIKDSEGQKRLTRYEKSLDDLNKELYKIQKYLKDSSVNMGNANLNEMQNSIKNDVRKAIDNLHSIIEKDREYVDSKISMLNDKIKEANFFPASSSGIDDRRIVSMFKDGWSIEAIARDLRITKSEVEFTLKLADIH